MPANDVSRSVLCPAYERTQRHLNDNWHHPNGASRHFVVRPCRLQSGQVSLLTSASLVTFVLASSPSRVEVVPDACGLQGRTSSTEVCIS